MGGICKKENDMAKDHPTGKSGLYQAFLEVLPLAGEGMLGVFATIIVLIAGVALLNRFGKKKDS